MKIAAHHEREPNRYQPKCAWPADCYVQWGSHGLVLPGRPGEGINTLAGFIAGSPDPENKVEEMLKQSRVTAFFEAFPEEPNTFIRGEGANIEAAEAHAFRQFERVCACTAHEFEKRGYTNGAGFCKHCGLFMSHVFDAQQAA